MNDGGERKLPRDWRRVAVVVCLAVFAGCASTKEPPDPVAERILELENAAAAAPKDARAQYTLGNAYFDAQRYADARGAYGKAVALDPGFADAYTNLGLVYRIEGNLEAAIAQYEKALAIAPTDAVARQNLIVALETAGRLPQVAVHLAELSRQDPEDLALLRQLAELYQHLEQYSEAEAAYTRLLTKASNDARVWFARGQCQQAQGNMDGAIASWSGAVLTDNNFVPAHEALLNAYAARGEYALAWEEVRQTQRLGGFIDPAVMEQLQEATGQLGPD